MCSSCCASKPERDSATIPTCELARLFFICPGIKYLSVSIRMFLALICAETRIYVVTYVLMYVYMYMYIGNSC